jgi:hypothetical protein
MRVRAMGYAVLVAAIASTVLAAGATGAGGSGARTIKCHVDARIQNLPEGSSPGRDFSFVTCPAPFGHGLQYSTFTMKPKTPTSGLAILHFKAYFNTGTVSGIWRAGYRFQNATTGVFTQKVTWTSGTGAFTDVRATGTGRGVLHSSHGEVDQVLSVTGLQSP